MDKATTDFLAAVEKMIGSLNEHVQNVKEGKDDPNHRTMELLQKVLNSMDKEFVYHMVQLQRINMQAQVEANHEEEQKQEVKQEVTQEVAE